MKQTIHKKIIGGVMMTILAIGLTYIYFHKEGVGTNFFFTCSESKTISATFYPKNDTHVDIILSDGRTLNLPHVISASGARYANTDESIVFWNKGNTAFITEGETMTFKNCITQSAPIDASATTTVPPVKKPTSGVINDGLYDYANSEYNFTMRFPPTVTTINDFPIFYHLASQWRINPSQANQGKPVVSLLIKQIDSGSSGVATGKAYPLFFTAQVRVGVSPNVKLCYENDAGYTSQKSTNVVINGVTFKKFSFSDAAMMKYIQWESYRTIHNNTCYVIEQIKAGSNYMDSTMTVGSTEAMLTNYYNEGEKIVKTFTFTK